jgi:hypothetical protein
MFPSGFVVWSGIRAWGFGVGQQRGCPLSRGSGRTHAGQHRHLRYAPCERRGKAIAGAGQRHLLPPKLRVWTAGAPRGPPALASAAAAAGEA